MEKELIDKTTIVTGGASGIGRAIVELFASQGALVYVFDLNINAADNLSADLRGKGFRVEAVQCDVSNQEHVLGCLRDIQKIDVLVNNAGLAHIGRADTTSAEDFDRIYQVNIKGAYNMLYACLPLMKSQRHGNIINMASIAAWVGIPDRFAYSVSKGAIAAMTLSVAKDYLKYGIRCNSISPARVHTPFVDGFLAKNYPGKEAEMFENLSQTQPIGRMAEPSEVASLALYLASEKSSFISGNDFPIDGGFIKLNN